MLGRFLFRTLKGNYPDGFSSLQLKSGDNILYSDCRLAPSPAIFLEPAQGVQGTTIGLVFRDRLIHSNQGEAHTLLKSGDNILYASRRTTIRVIFRWCDMYRFVEEPPAFDLRCMWVGLLRSIGAAMRSAIEG